MLYGTHSNTKEVEEIKDNIINPCKEVDQNNNKNEQDPPPPNNKINKITKNSNKKANRFSIPVFLSQSGKNM